MRLTPLRTLLLLPGLLAACSAQAQGPILYQPLANQPQTRYQLSSPTPYQAPKQFRVSPVVPVDADGAIKQEPDSATRRQYARHRVRTVLKTRLSKRGQVQDTLEYLSVDEHGRLTEVGHWRGPVHRQWSYNGNGECTALVEHPSAARPHTLISTYNPALRRGHEEVLQRNGTHTLVQEKQLYQHGDTLLTEIKAHELLADNYLYPQYIQRSFRLTPHPDTTLSLTYFYDQNQQPSSYQFDYLLYRHGRLLESGKIDLPKSGPTSQGTEADMLAPARVLAALRHGTGVHPQHRRFYDSQHRLVRQEVTQNRDLRAPRAIFLYTYNNLGQLISRENTSTNPGTGIRSTYTVYSYSATGLLTGETTNARSNSPVFYRYQYQYYE